PIAGNAHAPPLSRNNLQESTRTDRRNSCPLEPNRPLLSAPGRNVHCNSLAKRSALDSSGAFNRSQRLANNVMQIAMTPCQRTEMMHVNSLAEGSFQSLETIGVIRRCVVFLSDLIVVACSMLPNAGPGHECVVIGWIRSLTR